MNNLIRSSILILCEPDDVIKHVLITAGPSIITAGFVDYNNTYQTCPFHRAH